MEKKESPKKASPKIDINTHPKISGLSHRLFGVIKLILGISLLPFVYSATVAFYNELGILEKTVTNYFFGGIICFLMIYLFIYEPIIIYNKGQKILEAVFRFFTPLVKVAPYLLPIYTIILFLIYLLYSLVSKSNVSIKYFVLLFGFSMGLHLVFSARSLRLRQSDFLKANYIFGFSLIYIINLALLSLCFSFIFDKFSLVNFFNNSFQMAKNIFYAAFKQLFLS